MSYTELDNPKDLKELRHYYGKLVKGVYEYVKERYDGEAKKYVAMLRHEFNGILPERLLMTDRVDVNIVYPIIKTLIPQLYFQDPKVYVKAEEEKIVHPVTEVGVDEVTGEEYERPVLDPVTGVPLTREYDATKSALIFQNALNNGLDKARVKYQIKRAIVDAELGFYGAIKCGWGNDQGVASMGEGAPPSVREDVSDNLPYAMRLKPWDVGADMRDFYNPEFVYARYTVDPAKLKADKRLQNTEQIEGKTQIHSDLKRKYFKHLSDEDCRQTEYFEVFVKPCARYPQGLFMILTEEVPDDFLYISEWPYQATEFPIKFLFFNPDPEGDLPTPGARYYASQQKALVNSRNAEYEFVQRTMPIMGINLAACKDQDKVAKQVASGQIPRIVATMQAPNRVLGGVAFPSIGIDFRQFEANALNDVSRMVGLTSVVTPTANADNQLASALKLSSQDQQIRQNERADIVSDFLRSIVIYWAKLFQEFASPENYTTIEGEKFPVKWTPEEINGKFIFNIKPFSMSYEDPVVKRKQYVDLLNLLASPELRMALAEQGVQTDIARVLRRILETYDERDVENFIIDDMAKAENQVALAVQENEMYMTGQGQMVQVAPTDNHKLHIILHGLSDVDMSEHMAAHQMAMAEQAGLASPGGGNAEGMPVNGVAANQDLMKQSPRPNPANKKTAIKREASKA
jgi:hypothetical protein